LSLGLPTHLEPVSISRAFARSSHVLALVCLVAALGCIIAIQLDFPALVLWPLAIALIPMFVALWFVDRLGSGRAAALYLVLGGASIYGYALIGTNSLADPATDNLLLTLPKLALIMIGRPRIGTWSPVLWCVAAFVIAEGSTAAAAIQSGALVVPDATSILTTSVLVVILAFIAVRGLALQPAKPSLLRAARDEHLAALRARIETRAATVLHDTVLDHLEAVAAAPVGPLSPVLREQVARDLEAIVSEEWLSERHDERPLRPARFETSRFARVVEQATRSGLHVDVSGDVLALERLTTAQATAVALATQQCLSNVAKHAGVMRAEVVVVGTGLEVSVMVIDAGRGFDVGTPRRDRLGLSHSIQKRIEAVDGTVQFWSTPGRGTSVLLRVPALDMAPTSAKVTA